MPLVNLIPSGTWVVFLKKKEEEEEEEALKESNLHVTKLTQAAVSRIGDRNGEGLEAEETVRGLQ